MGLILFTSLVVSLPRLPWLGLAAWSPLVNEQLLLHPGTLPELNLASLLTNTAVNLSPDPSSLFMPLFLLLLFRMRELPFLLREKWKQLLLWFLAIAAGGTIINQYAVPGVWGLVGALLITGLMSPTVERMFGSRPFAWFCLKITLVTNLLGALILWLWPGSVSALLGPLGVHPGGIGPLSGAWLLTFALVLDKRTLAGIDVAINGRVLALILVGLDVYTLVFAGFLAGFLGLVALGLAWMHLHGGGSPRMLLDRFRLWRLERRRARFRVVPGGRDDGRIVHFGALS